MEPNTIFWMILIGSFVILFFIFKRREDRKLEDRYNQQLIQASEYPQIDIRHDVGGSNTPMEHFHRMMEYPFLISGTCNKIDYISQRFREWPTDFQINRFRHHCIYEYEKSGKSKVIDYEDCDGYESFN